MEADCLDLCRSRDDRCTEEEQEGEEGRLRGDYEMAEERK